MNETAEPTGIETAMHIPIPSQVTVAVVIPVRNQAKLLVRALSSAGWQLGPRDELIVVDDASNDLHDSACLELFKGRTMWLRNPIRRGVSFSRNAAIRRSEAEWIKFLDAEDVLVPFALDVLREAMLEIPEYVQVVTGGCHRILNGRYHDYLGGRASNLNEILKRNPILPSATFVKRDALLEVGMFDERIDFEEDWDLWLKIHEKYGLKAFAVTDSPVCYYWCSYLERAYKSRTYTVDGVPVREYLHQRYGVQPQSPLAKWIGAHEAATFRKADAMNILNPAKNTNDLLPYPGSE